DVVITDIAMPDRDGYELLRDIRASHDGLPVIALTAMAMAEDRERALEAGFTEFIAKPIDPVELRAAVARYRDRAPFPGDGETVS
ncbi:MAG TPA: response regulator, partial [Thermoanaerobaculia bacterium]|nr:response regulator [Thermoanaerobaculia bacterium]